MKTIFIPIFYKQQARNVLEANIFKIISARSDIRVVLFVSDFKKEYFQERYAKPNVVIEGVADIPETLSRLDALFHSFSLNYIDSATLRIFRRRYLARDGAVISYLIHFFATFIWARFKLLRRLTKWCDRQLIRDNIFTAVFDAYRPDLVFAPHLISKFDRAMLRQAIQRGIPTIGAVNSWDNITAVKSPIRILPDKLIAYTEPIGEESVRYLDMSASRITVTGLPHYDYYVTGKRSAREDFFRRVGADPSKRLILFSPAGATESDTDWQVVAILDRAATEGKLCNAQILVREHPVSTMNRGKLRPSSNVIFDEPFTPFRGGGRTFREITADDMGHLADSIFWSDVTINICSTLSVDAAAFDKPIVNVMFDGWEEKPYIQSIRRFYDHDHYRSILKSGGVKFSRTPEELVAHIVRYLEDPSLEREGRLRIVKEQCWRLDGRAGERIASVLFQEINLPIS